MLAFGGESGLVVIFHNDMVRPFTKNAKARPYFDQLTALYRRPPQTTIIWAHLGLGRVVQPVKGHGGLSG